MRRIFPILLAASLFLPSCKEDKITGEPITISRIGDELNLINQTEETLYYFPADENFLAIINWAPGIAESQPRLAPKEQVRIGIESISGYTSDTKTIVISYWEGVFVNDVLQPGPVNSLSFEL